MKIPYGHFFIALFHIFLLAACVSLPKQTRLPRQARRPNPATEMIKGNPAIIPSSPEELPPPLKQPFEQALEKIKHNGKDISRYFITDIEGRIMVKSDLRDEDGDFEIIYDLENARKTGNLIYEVDFSCREKESGLLLKDTLVWNPSSADAGGGLLLSFDDDFTASWERYFDLLEKYNAKVTFFIIGKANTVSVSLFCAKALNRGHDIGYHSLSHRDLRQMSREEFNRETIEAVKSFRDANIPLSSFAYPYGFYEQWMQDALLSSFRVLRGYGVTFRLYNEAEIRRGNISSFAIDNTVIPSDEDFYRIVNTMLMTVKFIDKKMVLPLTTHDISRAALWGIDPRRLEFLLKTANDLGLVFYRYGDFAK